MKPKDQKKKEQQPVIKIKPKATQNLNLKALDSKRLQMLSGKRGK